MSKAGRMNSDPDEIHVLNFLSFLNIFFFNLTFKPVQKVKVRTEIILFPFNLFNIVVVPLSTITNR